MLNSQSNIPSMEKINIFFSNPGNIACLVSPRQNIPLIAKIVKLSSINYFHQGTDITVYDDINSELRFSIIFVLSSHRFGGSLLWLITKTSVLIPIISLSSIFASFNWPERELWDMFGVHVVGHPDLRRILTDYGFSGSPLVKSYPVSGTQEVIYDDVARAIEKVKIELSQVLRHFVFYDSWNSVSVGIQKGVVIDFS